ncbi:hypothetical protein RN001_000344 [Aquatica leii]|uniref:Flavin-containing monooxygenase n=1 Tax=Aquatica leii TaxID=1421715 RepID=A0AAN7QLZ7_9COLE|nr:hypothetical protein RN001_000344 [Aquatica leii]
MKIAIIGAGVAGVVTLKYALERGHECECFEETGEFGGTWVYTDKTGVDENGMKIYRTMYKDLITNLPKEVMFFLDFPYPEHIKESIITQPQVLQYLTDYVNKFDLEKHIKYHQTVVKVRPHNDDKWTVTTENVINKTQNSKIYESVFVCNGHFRYPKLPNIDSRNLFNGLQMHSSDYRNQNLYKNKRVLVIGASYSGIDVANHIKSVTKKLCLSHWSPTNVKIESVVNKPAVSKMYPQGAVFADGTVEEFDIVIYCTGYEYKFPFLDDSCGITVNDNWVKPLYKHVINIERPTMYFIGIPFLVAAFQCCDIQARFSLAALEKKFVLPQKQHMLKDLNDYEFELKKNNVPNRHTHKIGQRIVSYFAELAEIAAIRPIPNVYAKLYSYVISQFGNQSKNYVILNDEHFIVC